MIRTGNSIRHKWVKCACAVKHRDYVMSNILTQHQEDQRGAFGKRKICKRAQ